MSISGVDHSGRVTLYRVGEQCRVFPNMGPNGLHPYGQGFIDCICSVFIQTDSLGNSFPAVGLHKVSWVPLTEIQKL